MGLLDDMIARTLLGVVLLTFWHATAAGTNQTSAPLLVEPDGKSGPNIAFWLESSLKRIFPASPPGTTNLSLLAARNSRLAFQACLQNRRVHPLAVACSISGADDLKPQVRRVGTVRFGRPFI